AFSRQNKSLFVYFQGHPEYEANSLLLEYRRDVTRFLRGESKGYPEPPNNYFDEETLGALRRLQREAIRRPRKELLAEVYEALLRAKVEDAWRPAANRIYRNWLEYVSVQKQKRIAAERAIETEPMRGRSALMAIGRSDRAG